MIRRERDDDDDDDLERDSHGALGRPGGDWAGMRPSIDNPFTWSLPLGRIGGISVRIHLLFLLFIIIELGWASLKAQGQPLTVPLMALAMGVLFVIVLVHEFGHCLACRTAGGVADEVLLWPLGGLAFCQPLPVWRAHFVTALGGPLVNLFVCILAGSMLGVLTNVWMGVAIPDLLHPFAVLDPFAVLSNPHAQPLSRSLAHVTLYMINVTSLLLLAFNLLPMFPLDGGRLVQALLWSRMGWSRSMRASVRLGYLTALGIGIFGAVTQNWMVVGVCLLGLWACWNTHRQLEFSDSMLGMEDDEYAMSLYRGDEEEGENGSQGTTGAAGTGGGVASRAARAALRREQQEEYEAKEVDRILDKIAHEGMHSLTRGERTLLERATERKRRQS